MTEQIECLECLWEGTRDECPEHNVCPNCSTDGYLIVSESEYDDEDL